MHIYKFDMAVFLPAWWMGMVIELRDARLINTETHTLHTHLYIEKWCLWVSNNCNTSENPQHTQQTLTCHRISPCWYWSAVCKSTVSHRKIIKDLNITAVRCIWEWFTKLVKSLWKFSHMLILSKYHSGKCTQENCRALIPEMQTGFPLFTPF